MRKVLIKIRVVGHKDGQLQFPGGHQSRKTDAALCHNVDKIRFEIGKLRGRVRGVKTNRQS